MTNDPLFFVTLEFADRSNAGAHMADHNAWIDSGINDNVFLIVGSVPGRGGAIVAHRTTRSDLDDRLAEDPFVSNGIVTPNVVEIEPSRTHPNLAQALGA